MVSNKKTTLCSLYRSGVTNNEERKYHWGFLVRPKHERDMEVPGTRYHVKNHPVQGGCPARERVGVIRADEHGRAVGTAEFDWDRIERVAREYVARKTASGRYTIEQDTQQPKPTWDMLQGKETIP
ncbi:hypothetical protein C7999DRAFT_10978 [Corynascus novoguineensis]|uniref:Uncharacterized protein n=1 Tax=Corynascus novoguineensis TaxID=1126955 RepID=A0AAN7CZN0_9PEZI|nr:hypothetical protein C7999DRAFT_10978 [Corynascus novoguineensis]